MAGSESKRILIAASGTGGHLFPALYIARALQRQAPGSCIEFVGSGRPLEERIIDRNGFKRHVVTSLGVKNLGLMGFLRFLMQVPRALVDNWRLISQFRPDAVVGVGGYVSVFPVLLAALRGIPTWIHEAELRPGLANWLLSMVATRTSVAFEQARLPWWARHVFTGHPVREELQNWQRTEPERIPPQHLLVLGGSQGARSLDEAAAELAVVAKEFRLSVRHQTREENCEKVRSAYASQGVSCEVLSFINDMAEAYRWGDIIVSRSGAGTVMELGIVAKPAILVPYPFAQGNHQFHNAQTLAATGKGVVVAEGLGFVSTLAQTLRTVLDSDRFRAMWRSDSSHRSATAASDIASGVLTLTTQSRS